MQALAIAIGKAGITKFAQQLIAQELVAAASSLQKPPDKSFAIPTFTDVHYKNGTIALTGTSMTNFNPTFTAIVQNGATFTATVVATNFSANYNWHEEYDYEYCYRDPDDGEWYCDPWQHETNDQPWSPSFGSLTITVQLGLVYDDASAAYQLRALSSSAVISGETASIPGWSVLVLGGAPCSADSQAVQAAEASIQSLDFTGPVSSVFANLVDSIPASGKLTSDITNLYGLGNSGLMYTPDGVQIGVTGTVTYQGQEYPGSPPPPVPLPLPPAQDDTTHHLRVYVSSYEMDALHWAYFQAGLLTATIEPTDPNLPDPDLLYVDTYTDLIPALDLYAGCNMTCKVTPKVAPAIAFQDVWIFTSAVMTTLKGQLPPDVLSDVQKVGGKTYVDLTSLEHDLTAAKVPSTYFVTVETAAKDVGMAVGQTLEFMFTINGTDEPSPPNFVFDVARTDVLQQLGLNATDLVQTLTYEFSHAGKPQATFVSSTVPDFPSGDEFARLTWPVVGEPAYDRMLKDLGSAGVPLPVMTGFHFVFEDAELSIQEGYVDILAALMYKTGS